MRQPSPQQLDALNELMNVGVGRAAGMLNVMLSSPITLNVPVTHCLPARELSSYLEIPVDQELSLVRLRFQGPIEGTAALAFPTDSAAKLVAALTGEEIGSPDLDTVRSGTLSEVGNIVINGVIGSMANILRLSLNYGLPSYLETSLEHLFAHRFSDPDLVFVVALTRFSVEDLDIEGSILLVFEVLSFDALLDEIDAVGIE